MSTIDVSPSNNGRGCETWYRSWTHFRVDRPSPRYCRVTFNHPPINTTSAAPATVVAVIVFMEGG